MFVVDLLMGGIVERFLMMMKVMVGMGGRRRRSGPGQWGVLGRLRLGMAGIVVKVEFVHNRRGSIVRIDLDKEKVIDVLAQRSNLVCCRSTIMPLLYRHDGGGDVVSVFSSCVEFGAIDALARYYVFLQEFVLCAKIKPFVWSQ